jgi:Xaa-Pro aminopeptidase
VVAEVPVEHPRTIRSPTELALAREALKSAAAKG